MKFLSNILLTIVTVFIFTGCMAATFHKMQTPKPMKDEVTLIIPKDKENKTRIFRNESNRLKKSLREIDRQIAEAFYSAAVYGKQQGYDYFALTSKNMNNLAGYPINDFDNLIKYCHFEKKSAKKYYKPRPVCWAENETGLFDLYTVKINVKYFKKPIPGLFLYNVDEVIKKTEKYL